jgi:hypothetical protein
MFRKLLKYLAIFIVGFFIIYQLILSDLNPMFSSDEFKFLDNSLEKVDVQKHVRIIDLYKKIYKVGDFNTILFSRRNFKFKYPSLEIVQDSKFGLYRVSKIPFVNSIFALKIERNHSLEKCIGLNFEISDFLEGNRGVDMAAKYYFNKDYSNLNDEELIKLIIMSSNPVLYNPKKVKRIKRFENKLRLYKSLIQENKYKE